MNILFIVIMKFLVLIKWLYRNLEYVVLGMKRYHKSSTQSNLFKLHVFLVSILGVTPTHILLKYRCPKKRSG